MRYPGRDIVTFVSVSATGTKDRLGIAKPVEVATDQKGCDMQPMSVKDKVSDTEFASATHKCIAPATATVLACKAEDRLEFIDTKYRVIGVRRYKIRGRYDHVDVICEEQHG